MVSYVLHLCLAGVPIVIAPMSAGFLLPNGLLLTADVLARWVLGVSFVLWMAVPVHWWFHWRKADALYERTGMYRLVGAFAVCKRTAGTPKAVRAFISRGP